MNQDDKDLYGLSPADFTKDQIKKMRGPTLWKHAREDSRFEDELLLRIKKLTDVRNQIELYSEYIQEDVSSSPKLIELINKLVTQETEFNTIQPYFNILTDKNKQYAMNLFLESGRKRLVYERFLDIITERYRYIDPSSKHLVDIIFELIEERRPRALVLYLIGHLSKERFMEVYPTLKKKASNSVIGCLLYYAQYVPKEDHLFILKTMGKLTGLHHIKNKQFKAAINPLLLKELPLGLRLQVLKDISNLQTYPFTHKISVGFIKNLLFPLIFRRPTEVDIILKNWEMLEKKIPTGLLECDFSS